MTYAHVDVESDSDRDVELRAASATAIKIFVNGKEVIARESYHQSFTPDSHIAPAKFKKGKNSILMKICQNDQKEEWAQDSVSASHHRCQRRQGSGENVTEIN